MIRTMQHEDIVTHNNTWARECFQRHKASMHNGAATAETLDNTPSRWRVCEDECGVGNIIKI